VLPQVCCSAVRKKLKKFKLILHHSKLMSKIGPDQILPVLAVGSLSYVFGPSIGGVAQAFAVYLGCCFG
jgi:hypothetical protein